MVKEKKSNKKTSKKKVSKKPGKKVLEKQEKKFNNPIVCEIYKVYKKGKAKIKKACGTPPEHHANKKELKKEDKLLAIILLILGVVLIGFLGSYYYLSSLDEFEFRGVEFQKAVDKGGITFYHTQYPIMHQGKKANYHVWLRKDPRKLNKTIEFEGEFKLTELVVINTTQDFSCKGYGSIAIGNLKQVLTSINAKSGSSENYSRCDTQGRYTYIEIIPGEESRIVQTGPSCYDFIIKDCEMLEVTERFIMEILERVPKKI